MHITLIACCLTAFVLTLTDRIVPDIIFPGTRRIEVEIQLDAGPMVDACHVQHVIAAGDTLSAIALERLGSSKRMREILDLNPDLEPRRLRIGERIWLPPMMPPEQSKEPTFVYLARFWPFDDAATPFSPSDKLQQPRRGRLTFLLVPASQHEAFTKAQQNRDQHETQALAADGKIQALSVDCPGHYVDDSDPTYKRRDTVVVERDEQGKYSVRVHSVAFDKRGEVTVPKVQANGSGEPGPDEESLWLLALAGGGGWLLWRLQRSRARQQLAAATA